ncbi:MAG: hypothetical protein EA411_10600 [Saprospirales bacterium]|nr:MAG: hypothetical protein EA411_10600 [Saprospirales bacterium]
MKFNYSAIRRIGVGFAALLAWVCLGWLLVSAVHFQKDLQLNGLEIKIETTKEKMHLLSEKILADFIHSHLTDSVHNYSVSDFPVRIIADMLTDHPYIESAVVYVGKSGRVRVHCEPRYPVARVLPSRGKSYFIDESGAIMPMADQAALRLPVVRGRVPSDATENEDDLARLEELGRLSSQLGRSDFLSVLIDQIMVTALGDYKMIPSLGKEKIELGQMDNIEEKLENLEAFYEQVIAQVGWNVYENISLKYEGQIVARRAETSSP